MAKAREEMAGVAVQGCLGQLRQIQAVKQQWAVDHQKSAEAVPADKEIAAYFPGQMLPVCPGGGKYTVGAVAAPPLCSAGHALPPAQ
jgi:hypothetical protein